MCQLASSIAIACPMILGTDYAHTCHGGINQTITFTVPTSLAPNCPANSACPMYMRLVTPGEYDITVQNANGTSNAIPFTVTSGSGTGSEHSPYLVSTHPQASQLLRRVRGQSVSVRIQALGIFTIQSCGVTKTPPTTLGSWHPPHTLLHLLHQPLRTSTVLLVPTHPPSPLPMMLETA